MRFLSRLTVFAICGIPAGLLVAGAVMGTLGVNPVEKITHETGDWTLRFLMVTLAITPIRRITKWNGLVRYRRMIGLFAFFYALLHFSTYLVLDHFFDLQAILEDVALRRYITVGFGSFLLLIPLALTSTNKMIQRLGGNKWMKLHRLVYVSAIGGVIHYYWLVKADVRGPAIYAGVLALLLGSRIVYALRRQTAGP